MTNVSVTCGISGIQKGHMWPKYLLSFSKTVSFISYLMSFFIRVCGLLFAFLSIWVRNPTLTLRLAVWEWVSRAAFPTPLSPDCKALWHIPACYRLLQHITVAPNCKEKDSLVFCPTPTPPSPLISVLTMLPPTHIHWGSHLFFFITSPVTASLWSANTAWAGAPVVPRCWVKPFPLGLISYPTAPFLLRLDIQARLHVECPNVPSRIAEDKWLLN